MKKTVVLTEKKIAAEAVADSMAITNRGSDYFENDQYIITWASGNLTESCNPEYYNKEWKQWKLETLPMIPKVFATKVDNKKTKRFNVIKKLLKNTDLVINAGDCDQEGEYIISIILEHAGYKKAVKRMWFSSLTQNELKRSLKNLKDQNDYKYLDDSARLRTYVDWVFGINATRAFTLKFSQIGEGIMNTGRVTTPTLNGIVKRYFENKNFKVEPYKVLVFEEGGFKFQSDRLKDPKKDLESSKAFKIEKSERKEISQKPNRLFSLNTLQMEANKLYGYSSAKTLEIAQKLYEKGYQSYPRTEAEALPEDYDLKELGMILSEHKDNVTINIKDKRIFNSKEVDKAGHHALIITEKKPSSFENKDSENIYTLIKTRTIAAFYPACEKVKYLVEGTFEGSSVVCKAAKTYIVKPGYKDVYKYKDKDNTDDTEEILKKEEDLPTVGDIKEISPKLEDRKTKAPPLYNERSLIAFMANAGKMIDEKLENGIGTVATRSEIIKKLNVGGFFDYVKTKIVPTEKGISLIEKIPMDEIKNPNLTVEIEGYFERIKKGEDLEKLKEKYIEKFKKQMSDILDLEGIDNKVETDYNCPVCNEKIIRSMYGYMCPKKEGEEKTHFSIPYQLSNIKITDQILNDLFEKGRTDLIKGIKSKAKSTFDAYFILDKSQNHKLTFEFPEKTKIEVNCPKCGSDKLKFGKFGVFCDSDCKGQYKFGINWTIAGAKITEKDMITILEGKKTRIISFKKEKGNAFKAKLQLTEEGTVTFTDFENKKKGRRKK